MLKYLFCLIFICSLNVYSQEECGIEHKNKKAIKAYEEGMVYFKKGSDLAIPFFREAIERDPQYIEAMDALGELNLKNYKENTGAGPTNNEAPYKNAMKYWLMILDICPSYYSHNIMYNAVEYYWNYCEWDKALPYLEILKDVKGIGNDNKAKVNLWYKELISFNEIKKNPVPFEPSTITGVCSKNKEYLPCLSADGETFYYTRNVKRSNKEFVTGPVELEEFTFSKRIEDGNIFSSGDRMAPPFNVIEGNQGGVTLSIDNKKMYLTICAPSFDGFSNCDLYYSYYRKDGWKDPERMCKCINGPDWESQPSLSGDGKTLYFVSDRSGGFGGLDIWKSEMQQDGSWGGAVNLGSTINTSGDEKSPFMHTDSKTLYFSSNGKPGFGGYDIYYSKMLENNQWDIPKNIGYPINTKSDDLGFFVSTDGKYGYFSSNVIDPSGDYEIYGFELYEQARPYEVMFLKGQVKKENGEPLKNSQVEIKNSRTNEVTKAMVDEETGEYAVAVALMNKKDANNIDKTNLKQDDYVLKVSNPEYGYTSQLIETDEIKEETKQDIIKVGDIKTDNKTAIVNAGETKPEKVKKGISKVNFTVKPLQVGQSYTLNNIHFETDKAIITGKSKYILDDFIDYLQKAKTLKIEIQGHTDNEGLQSRNMALSLERAKAVYDYIIAKGIEASRLNYKGYGDTKPIAKNDTPEGKALNRRTEFVILEK